MTARAKKRLFDGLRIAVCGAALWFVVQGVTLNDHILLKEGEIEFVGVVIDDGDPVVVQFADGREELIRREAIAADEDGEPLITYGLKTAWRRSARLLLFLAVLIHFPVGILQGVRLQWLLRAQNVYVGYWECVKLSFSGNFVNFATPLGSHAGDVFKAYVITTHTERKTEAATTIALDRAIGLGTLITCVAAITVVCGGDSRLAMFRPYALGVFGIGVAGVFLYLSPALRSAVRSVIPARWSAAVTGRPVFEQIRRIDRAARALASHRTIVVSSILVTILLQIAAVGAYFTIAVALALDAHTGNVLEYYAYFYTGAVIQALPGPPQGLGTVELAYRYFFSPYGSPSQIVCMAFAIRVVVLACSLPGLVVTLTGSYRPRNAVLAQQQVLAADNHPEPDGT